MQPISKAAVSLAGTGVVGAAGFYGSLATYGKFSKSDPGQDCDGPDTKAYNNRILAAQLGLTASAGVGLLAGAGLARKAPEAARIAMAGGGIGALGATAGWAMLGGFLANWCF